MQSLTAEQFAEQKFDLPDGGRWSELIAGELQALEPPDDGHGNVVLNLSKAMAAALRESRECHAGFELGLIVSRNPDTVLCPPISCFQGGELFAEADKIVTDVRPALVVEVASTPTRRQQTADRVRKYLDWGVATVWVFDPQVEQVHCIRPHRTTVTLASHQRLDGGTLIPDLEIPVSAVFAEPSWYRG